MNKWKYSISTSMESLKSSPIVLVGDLYKNMKKASEYGYNAVEFHARDDYNFDYNKIKELKSSHDVCISALITGRLYTEKHLSLLSPLEDISLSALNGLKMYIDKASKLSTDIVIGWAKGNFNNHQSVKAQLDQLANSLSILNHYSKEKSVKIFIEVINHYETNLFNTAIETLKFLETNDLDNCYIHLDTYHMNLEEFDPIKAIEICGDKLGYFHVADNTRWYPGSGQFDFKRILQTLENINYCGYIAVECLPEPDSKTAAMEAIKHLMQCE